MFVHMALVGFMSLVDGCSGSQKQTKPFLMLYNGGSYNLSSLEHLSYMGQTNIAKPILN